MSTVLSRREEEFLARLTRAAYDVALRRASSGSFLQLELEIWDSLRGVIEEETLSPSEFEVQVA